MENKGSKIIVNTKKKFIKKKEKLKRQQKQNIFEFLIITINRFSNYQHHSNYDENSRNIIFYIFIFFKSKIFLLIKEFNDFELH